jgi:hypothetical protein
MRLSETAFIYKEHALWIEEGERTSVIKARRKLICKIRAQIREYIEVGDAKAVGTTDVVVDVEAKSIIKPSSLLYMDAALHTLTPPVESTKKIRKVQSFPCIAFPTGLTISVQRERRR